MPTEQTIELEPRREAQTPAVTQLAVTGMTCGNCARHVAEAIQSVPGVHSATVNLEANQATVRWAASTAQDTSAVLHSVTEAGYEARVIEAPTEEPGHHALAGWQLNLWVGVLGMVPLMLGEWLLGLSSTPWFRWFSFVLALIVQVFAGARFYRGAWSQLKAGRSNMDTLVALGSTTAFVYSTWALFSGWAGHLYFMEAAAIITLISVGHWAESRVSVRASSALRQLLKLAPDLARRRNPDGTETEVAVADLKPADLAVLRPGDRVPTDGEVVEGVSALDESMLTGESMPADKAAGSSLYAGTVNVNGRLLMRVTATGEATALAHIIAAVQRAQSSRANIQRLADRVSNVFVPIVVLVALTAGLWWGLAPESAAQTHAWLGRFLWTAHVPAGPLAAGLITAAAVLIIACPCAMGLATPAAIMAGSNAAAQRGILIRDGVALEKAGRVTAVIFDKTGTLTAGKAEVVEVWAGGEVRIPVAAEVTRLKLPGDQSLLTGVLPKQVAQTSKSAVSQVSKPAKGECSAIRRTADMDVGDTAGLETCATLGQPPLTSAATEIRGEEPGAVAGKVLALAAALGRHSTHPISQAVAQLSSDGVDLQDWEEVRGSGVQARIALRTSDFGLRTSHSVTRLGSLHWLEQSRVSLSAGQSFIQGWAAQGATLVGLATGNSLQALFAVKDTLKPGAAEVVRQLQHQGLRTYLLTGDNALTAASIAAQVGIPRENIFAEVRPEQKAEFVQKLQHQGERVAFVGDGINDAPALEQADLGVAVSRASDVAREAADIILLRSEIEAVPEALGLARATLRTIKQNLFWAFFYNAIGIPLAALGFMSPILCAAAMGVSDLVVIGNALRLRAWRLR